jgi:acid phosphatase type 7
LLLHPVLVGAGDIATAGTADTATANLVLNTPGTVFTAGDNAYPDGTALDYTNKYHPTWGQFKDRTYPTPGNHE